MFIGYGTVDKGFKGINTAKFVPINIPVNNNYPMKNKAREGVSRDKYSMRQSRMLYLFRDTFPNAFLHTDKLGGALIDILYFLKIKFR